MLQLPRDLFFFVTLIDGKKTFDILDIQISYNCHKGDYQEDNYVFDDISYIIYFSDATAHLFDTD